MPTPNPEQTASLISLVFFSFLDHIVFAAYRMPHFPFDRLPPLADYDYLEVLKRRSFPVRPIVIFLERLKFYSILIHILVPKKVISSLGLFTYFVANSLSWLLCSLYFCWPSSHHL